MSECTTTWTTARLGFAYRIGREIILVHIPLGGFFIQAVNLLAIANRAKCCNGQNLCLSSCEQTRTMYTWQQTNFSCKRTDFINASSIYTLALIQPIPNNFLLQLVQALINHRNLFRIRFIKLLMHSIYDRLQPFFSYIFIVGIQGKLYLIANHFFDLIKQRMIHFHGLERKLLLTDCILNFLYKRNHLLDLFVTG